MNGPCKDCPRRKVGCHNVDTCEAWRVYVDQVRAAKENRNADRLKADDVIQHMRRHGVTIKAR